MHVKEQFSASVDKQMTAESQLVLVQQTFLLVFNSLIRFHRPGVFHTRGAMILVDQVSTRT